MIMFARDDEVDVPPSLTDEQQELFDAHVCRVERIAQKRAAKQYHVEFEDHLQHGLMGLLEAARRFEPEKGLEFWTFAYPRVVGAMISAVRNGCWSVIKIGREEWRKMNGEQRSKSQGFRFEAIEQWRLSAGSRRPAEAEELAVEVDEPPFDREAIWLEVNRLGKRSRRLVKYYYVRGLPMREISQRLGVSEPHVSRLHSGIVERLRHTPRVLAASGRRATA